MRSRFGALALVVLLILPGCSIRQRAVNSLADALAASGSSYASDDDPELVGAAVPFALKTIEVTLAQAPRHQGLLLAAARGFTQYAYAYVQQEADFSEDADLPRATALRTRAGKLFLRAREYGLRGLEVDLPGLREGLRADPAPALAAAGRHHVGLLYWTGAAWFAAISLAKDDSTLSADQSRAEALMRRALALDEGYERGAIHEFFISWEARGEALGGSFQRARDHLERALALGQGAGASALVNFAERVCVAQQDRREFERLLQQALEVDLDRMPELRLTNVIYQRRARWLLGRADELFIQ